MSDYTPKTKFVRAYYVDMRRAVAEYNDESPPSITERAKEFNRWLDSIKAEAWQEGHAATLTYVGIQFMPIFNPYRSDQ